MLQILIDGKSLEDSQEKIPDTIFLVRLKTDRPHLYFKQTSPQIFSEYFSKTEFTLDLSGIYVV